MNSFVTDIVCFQKNIQTTPWKELKILKGSGARRPKKFQWGEGIEDKNSLSEGHVQ